VPAALEDVAAVLRRQDPDLEVRIGVIADEGGREVDRRFEVWRHCEDGQDRRIGSWRSDEVSSIVADVAVMRAGATGRTGSAVDRIEAHNARTEAAKAAWEEEVLAAIQDHLHFVRGPDRPWRSASLAPESANRGGGGRSPPP
jgi:hypothetical protein